MAQSWKEEFIDYEGAKLQVLKGGRGAPLLVLHGVGGSQGWLGFHEALSKHFTVHAPSHPGYNKSERVGWVDSITALAHYYHGLIRHLGFGEYYLMGSSMGGWLAAEMASMRQDGIKKMALGAPVGIRPKKGEIAELFLTPRSEVEKLRFYDTKQIPNYEQTYGRKLTAEEQNVERQNREMSQRLCWQPYMHNPNLPQYLKKVSTPTLIVWGKQDAIVPVECAELFHQAMVNSKVQIIDKCGHVPQVEKPREFLEAVEEFLTSK
ncbi:MAG: alpha/beta hydrolase [SAR202 cluster bacterium]|nr:alpha/beta hydrolase [SAR202 cluster bacterium]